MPKGREISVTRQMNIVSFDEARRAYGGRGSAYHLGADRYAGLDYYDERYGSIGQSVSYYVDSLPSASPRPLRLVQGARPSSDPLLRVDVTRGGGRSAARGAGRAPRRPWAQETFPPIEVRVTRGKAFRDEDDPGRPHDAARHGGERREGAAAHDDRAQARERARRNRAKAKAERAFNKQYAGSPAEADAGPRAAVYKGEMGSAHRRSVKLQGEGAEGRAASPSAQGRSLRAAAAAMAAKPVTAVCCSVLVCLVLACSFLYPSARTYYQAVREEARLQLVYDALSESNAALQSTVDALQTDAGVEARARSQYGWVGEGEQAARVSGVQDVQEEAEIATKVQADQIKAPTMWYSPLLDLVFGVEN